MTGQQNEMAASLRRDGFGPDEIAAMCTPTASIADAPDPTPLRWGLNDVLWGDDGSVTVLLSGPDGEPYWLELDAERAAVLREDLAGPDGDPIARVRALHTPKINGTCAARCYSTGMAPEPWPCPTIRALDAPTT
ncbi:hypothetical protein ACIQHU_01215 [Streptomyces tendae]|uniref:hypothetical protein n=1 Tax=Streptomyces tendae TaxID=1932 RepID=UPI0037F7DB93